MNTEVVTNLSATDDYVRKLRDRILFALSVFKFVSPSMLHVALGTSTDSAMRKAITKELVDEGLVCESTVTLTSPHDRTQNYTVLHLAENTYDPPCNEAAAA